ncbi:hypothetical protein B9479_006598 [Cryptococcus floricola]|uniref:Uncharacterized protein n=1 Tax=Cryptococcus floricola TaxID=2591691 RepID=A0A5D3APP0_9TREE|nr:hypothetical protein B9479_006598 [Cryptococcus floricola]
MSVTNLQAVLITESNDQAADNDSITAVPLDALIHNLTASPCPPFTCNSLRVGEGVGWHMMMEDSNDGEEDEEEDWACVSRINFPECGHTVMVDRDLTGCVLNWCLSEHSDAFQTNNGASVRQLKELGYGQEWKVSLGRVTSANVEMGEMSDSGNFFNSFLGDPELVIRRDVRVSGLKKLELV